MTWVLLAIFVPLDLFCLYWIFFRAPEPPAQPKSYWEATEEEKAGESARSKAIRMLGV